MAARTLSVVQVSPVPESLNPYVHILARSMNMEGARCRVRNRFSLRWLLTTDRKDLDVLHLHWAEHICSTSTPGRAFKDFFQLLAGLLYAKATQCRVVYTVHNLDPHESKPHPVSLLAHRLVVALADGLHVHDEQALSRVSERVHGRKLTFMVPHGHYIGAYPNQCDRTQARTRLGLEENVFAYLFLGQMRPHKGIEDLVDAFHRIAKKQDRLIIAGWAPQNSYGKLVQEMTEDDSRIIVFRQFVADDDIQYFMNASDVCVLPYRTMTTSGAAILALSFGRPVVAPRLGGFPLLLRKGGGTLYDPGCDGLSQALFHAQTLDLETSRAEALEVAMSLDWGPIARQHLVAYENLTGDHKPKC